ncbi:MAG: SDR family NAD(P)-dependent oxidoreductase, partial [Pseudonocardiaceae bacterium]
LVLAYAVEAMSRLKVEWKPGSQLGGSWAAYGVADRHRQFWARLVEMLADIGVVDDAGVVLLPPPQRSPAELVTRIEQRYPTVEVELALVRRGGENLADILAGRADLMATLLVDDGGRLLERLYRDTRWMRYYNAAIATAVTSVAEATRGRRPLRVLEIGAGTGATTEYVLAALDGHEYEYWFTDLAPTLLVRAEQKFAGHECIRYHKLDIEQEPAAQGLPVAHYDVVLAANVLHATTDLRQTLANVHALLCPGGWLVLLEGVGKQPWLDMIVGGTDGWWKFRDDVRDRYPLLPLAGWKQVLAEADFDDTVTISGPGHAPPQCVAASRRRVRTQDAVDFRWLIVGSGDPFDLCLADALGRRGAAWVMCQDAAEVSDLLAESRHPWRIVYTKALAATSWRQLTDELLSEVETEYSYGAVEVIQAVRHAAAPGRFWLVTRGAQPAGDARPLELAQTPLWGIGRVAAAEHPELWGGLVDLDPDGDDNEAAQFLAEVLSDVGEDQIARRAGRWLVPRLLRSDPAAALGEGIRIRPDAAYLITGGLRGIGLAVAGWLAEKGARRLVLLSRTQLPPRCEWRHLPEGHPRRAEVEAVRRLEASGVEVIVGAVDVVDRAQLEAFLARYVEDDRPTIRGVVHSAGLISDAMLAQLDREAFAAVTRAKIRGSWLLHELLGGTATDFMVLFSSATSLLGTFGQANYAAGNAFVDALAHHRRALGQPAIAINWGLWASIGIVARMAGKAQLVESGQIEITPRLGLAALDRILRLNPAQIAAMPTDWHRFRQIHPRGRERPFLKALLDEDVQGASASVQHDSEVDALRAIQNPEARRTGVRSYLARRICEVMRLDKHALDEDAPLNGLGMDSIMAVTIRNALENDLGVGISITELLEGATTADLIDRSCAAIEAVAADGPDRDPPPEEQRITALACRSGPLPCSPAQEVLWFIEDINRARVPMYNVPVAASIRERLDASTLKEALAQLVTRHESLRTSFTCHNGRPHQLLHEHVDVAFSCEDLASLAPEEQERRARELATDLAARPFDLTVPSLARFLLVQKRHSSLFVISIHHLVFDGWSAGILVQELAERYQALADGTPMPRAQPTLQFADYAAWLSERHHERDRDVRWFIELLAGRWDALELPIDFPRLARPTYAGAKLAFELDVPLTTAVYNLARMTRTTPFSVLAAALATLLLRDAAQRDVVIATTPSHRPRPETAEVIGYFVNTLLLPMSLDTDQSFGSLLAQVRETTLGAFEHATAPLDDVLAAVRKRRGATPPIQVVLTLQNSPMRLPDIVERFETVDNGTAKFELVLNVVVNGDRMDGWWEYSTDLFRPHTIAGLSDRFVRLLALVSADPELHLDELLARSQSSRHPLTTEDERAAFNLSALGPLT